MALLTAVRLVPADARVALAVTAQCDAAPTPVGRSALSPESADPRCSRHQLLLSARTGTGATVTATGPNPSLLLRKSGEQSGDAELLPRGCPVGVADGDTVFLVGRDYAMRVELVYSAPAPAPQGPAPSPSPVEAAHAPASPVALPTGIGALWEYVRSPHKFGPDVVLECTDGLVAIHDRYPKSRVHILVVTGALRRPADLLPEHAPLVESMIRAAERAYRTACSGGELGDPRIGFHAAPSMAPLHMHALSPDLVSGCVKNKRHWNSFATEFLVPASEVLRALRAGRKGSELLFGDKDRAEAILKRKMACHRCGKECSTVPAMQSHAASCTVPAPTHC
eukprot:m51a1_g13830 hypothetical protein (338) ;mRNA; r:486273-487286